MAITEQDLNRMRNERIWAEGSPFKNNIDAQNQSYIFKANLAIVGLATLLCIGGAILGDYLDNKVDRIKIHYEQAIQR